MSQIITAASCSASDVQAAINSAIDGDTVIIPAGTATWNTGITISGKAIHLRALNLGDVTITRGAQINTIAISEAVSGCVEVSHLIFDGLRTDTDTYQIAINGLPTTRPCLIHDNIFNGKIGNISAATIHGVVWNNVFDAGPWAGTIITTQALHNKPQQPEFDYSWTTPSTMGADDLTGENNFYFENNTITNHTTEALDADDNSRLVVRYNTFRESGMGSHGNDTSPKGTRHWEVYNNTFIFTDFHEGDGSQTANINYWFYVRGGTGVIANNIMPDLLSVTWGDKPELVLTVQQLRRNTPCYVGPYPAPRQPGQSHDGVSYITDPIYIWNNTGLPAPNPYLQDYSPDECGGGPPVTDFIQLDRDYKLSAKPGYTPYTYPHPLTVASPPPPPPPPPPPTPITTVLLSVDGTEVASGPIGTTLSKIVTVTPQKGKKTATVHIAVNFR